MQQQAGQCDFCNNTFDKVFVSKPGTKICRSCLKTANHVLIAAPKGAVACPACKGYSLFSVTYEDGVRIVYKRQTVTDARGLQIYQVASVTSPKGGTWLGTSAVAVKCSCGLCNTPIPLEYLKDSDYVS